ncbi:MAG: YqgE/AlgH family protein [Alphaproteobacteria bacterium]
MAEYTTTHEAGFLKGQLLVAMPTMQDLRFDRAVIYMCAHSREGAMGLVINKPAPNITFTELMDQLGIETGGGFQDIRVHFGGPVETSRGFVLHSSDYFLEEATLRVTPDIGLTATVDILRALVGGSGPRHSILALGYAGWASGQLETELQANGWLHCPADEELLFGVGIDDKWSAAMQRIGIDPAQLSGQAGRA